MADTIYCLLNLLPVPLQDYNFAQEFTLLQCITLLHGKLTIFPHLQGTV